MCPDGVPPYDPAEAQCVVDWLVCDIDGAWADQYANLEGPALKSGPDTEGKVTISWLASHRWYHHRPVPQRGVRAEVGAVTRGIGLFAVPGRDRICREGVGDFGRGP